MKWFGLGLVHALNFAALIILLVFISYGFADDYREVSFQTEDGGTIFGNIYGSGEHAVVLAHGAILNKETWHPLAIVLAGEGLQVLGFDFRGYGKSKAGR